VDVQVAVAGIAEHAFLTKIGPDALYGESAGW
jgi:hypothetical protein